MVNLKDYLFEKSEINLRKEEASELVAEYGSDIISSPTMENERIYYQHGNVSILEHSISVAILCVIIAEWTKLPVNLKWLIRGALLHDYFLYDWHDGARWHKWHGLRHGEFARENAVRDFGVGELEQGMIKDHMFPLTRHVPDSYEGKILCVADKWCACNETASHLLFKEEVRKLMEKHA